MNSASRLDRSANHMQPLTPRLARLDFTVRSAGHSEAVVPPVCDVPEGTFSMGSADDEQAAKDERPQHEVYVPDFQIARFPVTVAEYACFVRSGHLAPPNPYHLLNPWGRTFLWSWRITLDRSAFKFGWKHQLSRPEHPVVNISWFDAAAYAAWLAAVTGKPWRLPSEAEWEKAARWDPATGKARTYPWGDVFDTVRANTEEGGIGGTTPIGSYPAGASPCGAQDMAGNVWEWTRSRYGPYPYLATDGREDVVLVGPEDTIVRRGGEWEDDRWPARAAFRGREWANDRNGATGFRLVLEASE
jgi:gamma-glutamyl hercynylcysteine S-oxide synthase